jgi:hypothetical protein
MPSNENWVSIALLKSITSNFLVARTEFSMKKNSTELIRAKNLSQIEFLRQIS